MPRCSWSHAVCICYSDSPKTAGKKLREVMEAASALVRGPLDVEGSEASNEWERCHSEYFDSPEYGVMELKNKLWSIHCFYLVNASSTWLPRTLPTVPKEEAAGVAFIEMKEELKRLHDKAA